MTSGTSGTKRSYDEAFSGDYLPREWISTWNNYEETDISAFRSWCGERTTFSVVGCEVGKQGTPHLQGFHQNGKIKFAPFHKVFPKVWVTPVGKDNGCVPYCEKDDKVVIRSGEYVEKKPGNRSDRHAVAKMAVDGKSMLEIAQSAPEAMILWANGIGKLVALCQKPRDRNIPKVCICLYGKTGNFKTRRIYEHVESLGEKLYPWNPGLKGFFQGYNGEKHVLMDEFRGQIPMDELLQITDRYPMRVNLKNYDAQFVADFVYFTSPMHPKDWYTGCLHDPVQQLERRFGDRIIEVLSPDQIVSLS